MGWGRGSAHVKTYVANSDHFSHPCVGYVPNYSILRATSTLWIYPCMVYNGPLPLPLPLIPYYHYHSWPFMTFITILNGPLLPLIHEHREPDKAGIDLGGRVHENIHMIIYDHIIGLYIDGKSVSWWLYWNINKHTTYLNHFMAYHGLSWFIMIYVYIYNPNIWEI